MGMRGIEPRLALCRESFLPAVLLLYPQGKNSSPHTFASFSFFSKPGWRQLSSSLGAKGWLFPGRAVQNLILWRRVLNLVKKATFLQEAKAHARRK